MHLYKNRQSKLLKIVIELIFSIINLLYPDFIFYKRKGKTLSLIILKSMN